MQFDNIIKFKNIHTKKIQNQYIVLINKQMIKKEFDLFTTKSMIKFNLKIYKQKDTKSIYCAK